MSTPDDDYKRGIREGLRLAADMIEKLPAHKRLWGEEHIRGRVCEMTDGHQRGPISGRCAFCNLRVEEPKP